MTSLERAGEPSFVAPRIGLADRDARLRALLGKPLATLGSVRSLDPDNPADWVCDTIVWAAASDDADALDRVPLHQRLVLVVPAAEIDLWSAAIGRADTELVTDDEPEAILRAVARRPRNARAAAREGADDDTARRLHELSLEVGRIAQALGALGEDGGVEDRRPPYRAGPAEGDPIRPAQIRAMIRARRLREQYFATGLFADPAWDMLLDLMAARLEGREVAVSSLCIAAAVPPTTALRWIGLMTEDGLLVRVADPADRRRVFIRLSDDAAERMHACLRALLPLAAAVA